MLSKQVTETWPCPEIEEKVMMPQGTVKRGRSSEKRKHFWLCSLGNVMEEVLFQNQCNVSM